MIEGLNKTAVFAGGEMNQEHYSKLFILLFVASALMVSCNKGKVGDNKDFKPELNKYCGPELKQFCKDVKSGGGRYLKCLVGHKSELSQYCKEHIILVEQSQKNK